MVQKNQLKRGFTIVELLIVIVVIGILAAITIVSYNGITARANTTKAATNAANAQKVIEAFNADCGRYPGTIAEVNGTNYTAYVNCSATVTTSRSSIIPSGLTVTNTSTALSGSNGLTNVTYEYVGGTATTATGGRLKYWDFTTGAASTTVIYLGSATSGSTFVNPA